MTAPLSAGDAAPALKLDTTAGPISLPPSGGRGVIVFFYPKDNTPGCTTEAKAFTEMKAEFDAKGFDIVGVSRDPIKSHLKFATKFQLSINLISDESEELCTTFDVLKNKNMYGKVVRGIERSTFLYDKHGKLVKEWRKVSAEQNPSEVINFVKTTKIV